MTRTNRARRPVTLAIETLDDRVLPSPMVVSLRHHARHHVRHHHVAPVAPATQTTASMRGAFRTAAQNNATSGTSGSLPGSVFPGSTAPTNGTPGVIQGSSTATGPVTMTVSPTTTDTGSTGAANGAPGSSGQINPTSGTSGIPTGSFYYNSTTTSDGSVVIVRGGAMPGSNNVDPTTGTPTGSPDGGFTGYR